MQRALVLVIALVLPGCGQEAPEAAKTPVRETGAPASDPPPPKTAIDAPASGAIPTEFRHVWAIEQADCANEAGLTRIAITEDGVDFYEGRSQVLLVNAPHDGVLTMEVEHAAEGESERQTHTLAINEETGKLSYARGGATFEYIRCS